MTKRCPITYESISNDTFYSAKGLRRLSPRLDVLKPVSCDLLAYPSTIHGRLDIQKGTFEILNHRGDYILKPASHLMPDLPANEDLTLRLAKLAGIETPVHGLLEGTTTPWVYFMKRFDQMPRGKIVPRRDILSFQNMEDVVEALHQYATFPIVERAKLWQRLLFSFLVGHQDFALKNFSFIERKGQWGLAPAYDMLNTTLAMTSQLHDFSLPLRSKTHKLSKDDLVYYFAKQTLGLTDKVVDKSLQQFYAVIPRWAKLIQMSFLSPSVRRTYWETVVSRSSRLWG